MARFRVEELAAAAQMTVPAVRAYQSKGLLQAPRHDGKTAVYDERHLERLQLIAEMKQRGYSLRAIGDLLRTRRVPLAEPGDEGALTVRDLAQQTGVPPAMLRSLEASGVLRPLQNGEGGYTDRDVQAVKMLLALLGSGLPMEEFMRVARVQLEAARDVAEGATELFLRYVRDPLRRSGMEDAAEAEQLAASFRLMLEATTTLMTYNFHRMVLNAVHAQIDTLGSDAEREALRRAAKVELAAALEAS